MLKINLKVYKNKRGDSLELTQAIIFNMIKINLRGFHYSIIIIKETKRINIKAKKRIETKSNKPNKKYRNKLK